jgi:hypothetical protein
MAMTRSEDVGPYVACVARRRKRAHFGRLVSRQTPIDVAALLRPWRSMIAERSL